MGTLPEVAIVGGSVSGLYAATLLARRGAAVRVYEGADSLVPLERSLIVTSAYRDILGDLGEPAIKQEINAFELFTNGKMAEVQLDRPDLIIERARLIESLESSAISAGAEIHCGHRLETLEPHADGVRLSFRGGAEEAHARTVIGADGARSSVARHAGWRPPTLIPVVQAVVKLPAGMALDRTRVWFVPDETPYFYWLIPHSDTHGALGIIDDERARARPLLDAFAERRGLEIVGYQGALIPEYRHWIPLFRRMGRGTVCLVGDAAAHVKVTTVGGIVDGLWGARGVCDRLVGTNGGPRRSLRSLRVELGLHRLIRRVLHRFSEADYSRLLEQLGSTGRRTLGRYTRDDTLRLLARLACRRPGLAWLGLRGLIGTGWGVKRASSRSVATLGRRGRRR